MAAFDFPDSPSNNQTHTENNVTWKWDAGAEVWRRITGVGGTAGPQGAPGAQGLSLIHI